VRVKNKADGGRGSYSLTAVQAADFRQFKPAIVGVTTVVEVFKSRRAWREEAAEWDDPSDVPQKR